MMKLTKAEYQALLRRELCGFIKRCFHQLSPQATSYVNWHIEVMVAKLEACLQSKIRRLIINFPRRAPIESRTSLAPATNNGIFEESDRQVILHLDQKARCDAAWPASIIYCDAAKG
jgi:hypothetical protein